MNSIFLFVSIYLAALILISFWNKKKSAEDFILAERKLGNWAAANSMAATTIGGGILLVGGSLIYQFGISALWFFIGKVIGYLLLILFIHKISHQIQTKKYCTLADYFLDTHGQNIGRLVSIFMIIIFVGVSVLGFSGGAQIITYLSGWSYNLSVLLMLIFILLYTIAGGFRNVVRTDFIQWIAISAIFILFLFSLKGNLPLIQSTQWDFWAAGSRFILAFFVAGILFPFSAMEVWQRLYAIEKRKDLLSTMSKFLPMYLLFGVVLCLVVMLIRTFDATLDPEMALVTGIVKIFPSSFVALGTVAFFAAIMSSIDSYLFVANASLVHDWLDRKKKHSSQKIEKNMQWTLLVFGIIAAGGAIIWKDLLDIALYFSALTISISLLTISSWISKQKISESTLLTGGISSILLVHLSLFFVPVDVNILIIPIIGFVVGLVLDLGFEKLLKLKIDSSSGENRI
ncbi:hypothetical protein K9M41_03775 [Candidatus Gracilibacteria bacterium]|nr:hypothetical protein [Candidatus Gracilibacteria bacterium]